MTTFNVKFRHGDKEQRARHTLATIGSGYFNRSLPRSAVPEFTQKQLANFHKYVKVQQKGKYNMISHAAGRATGLPTDEYLFVLNHFSALKKAAEIEAAYALPPHGYTAEELERDNPYNQWMYEE